MMEKKIVKKEQGITIIALIVTIIILLILASISIAMVNGDNGLVTQANEAEAMSALSDGEEYVELEVLKVFSNTRNENIFEEISETLENTIDGIKTVNLSLTAETPFNNSKNKVKLTYKKRWSVVGVVNIDRRNKMDTRG